MSTSLIRLLAIYDRGTTHVVTANGQERSSSIRWNPQTTDWSTLVSSLASLLGENLQIVSFIDWVTLLKESISTGSGFWGVDEGINPAAKLLDFFATFQDKAVRFPKANSVLLEAKQTIKVSRTLASLEAVGSEWIGM